MCSRIDRREQAATYYFHRLCLLIYEHQENESKGFLWGSRSRRKLFWRRLQREARSWGIRKEPVFGLLKRGGKVYTSIIPDVTSNTLMPVICDKVVPDSMVYTDSFRSHNVLDVSEFKHFRINHAELFAKEKNHINGIENFWNQAKRHLRRFNGISRQHFGLFLKECEFRFNTPADKDQLKTLKQLVKRYMG